MRAVIWIALILCTTRNPVYSQPSSEWLGTRITDKWSWAYDSEFLSDSVLYVVGGNVCKSVDGGRTWGIALEQPFTTSGFGSIHFPSDSVGFVSPGSSPRSFLRTTDGGQTWIERSVDFDMFSKLVANDSLHAFCYGTGSRLHYTDDGGVIWYTVPGTLPNTTGSNIFAVDSLSGYLVILTWASETKVYRTTNGGHTWTLIRTFDGPFYGAEFQDDGLSYLAFQSTILRTSDGWATWDTVYVGEPTEYIRDIKAVSDSIVMAFTVQGILLKSVDRGDTWRSLPIAEIVDSGRLIGEADIAFLDSLRGAVFIQYGEAYSTTDGGETWFHYDSRAQSNFVTLAEGDEFLWILDDENTVWRGRFNREEEEIFWRYSIPTNLQLRDIQSQGDSVAWAVGDSGTIMRTEDRGESWTQIESPTTLDLTSVAYSADFNYWYACGDSGVILRSDEDGITWVVAAVGDAGKLNFIEQENYYGAVSCVGDSGALLRSVDGVNWERLETPTIYRLLGFSTDDADFTIYGEQGTWFYTANGGLNWQSTYFTDADIVGYREWWGGWPSICVCSNGEYLIGRDVPDSIDVRFTDLIITNSDFIACGDSGVLLAMPLIYFDAPEHQEILPNSISLSAYPNPFNSTATLQFELPRETRVEIVLYDVLGRIALNLADEIYTSGAHTLKVDAASLASGVYFANLHTPQFSTTQKLLLLR